MKESKEPTAVYKCTKFSHEALGCGGAANDNDDDNWLIDIECSVNREGHRSGQNTSQQNTNQQITNQQITSLIHFLCYTSLYVWRGLFFFFFFFKVERGEEAKIRNAEFLIVGDDDNNDDEDDFVGKNLI